MLLYVLAVAGAYLLGSIPFGLLVSKALGEADPRTMGSKNIGFTNVLRVSGKKSGILTLIGDIGKGVLATGIAQSSGAPRSWVLLIGLSVILGHIFSVFLRLKGGKGVATASGAVLGIDVFLGVCLIGIWIGAVIIFQYSSGGALGASVGFPLLAYVFDGKMELILFSLVVMVLILYSHKENIDRLLRGTEPRLNLFSN